MVPLLVLLGVPHGGAEGFNPTLSEASVNSGSLWILAAETVKTTTAVTGPILFTLGASLPWRFWDPFFAEAMLDIWGTTYEYDAGALRAVPIPYETNNGFLVLAALLSLQAGARWTVAERLERQPDGPSTVAERLELGGALGFDFLFRLPLDYNGGTASPAERTAGAASSVSYFYGSGRFFYPESRLFAAWRINPGFGMTFSLRALWPLFHAWDGEGALFTDPLEAFADQTQLAGTLGFTIYFK